MTIPENPSQIKDKTDQPVEGLLHRMSSYALVTNFVQNAKSYYVSAKDKSPFLKRSCETAESTVSEGFNWFVPKVEPVFQYSGPILASVDRFGCSQLDRMERIVELAQNSRKKFEDGISSLRTHNLSDLKISGKQQIEATLTPIDEYLKTSSIFSPPLKAALNITEGVVERILPADSEEEQTEEHKKESPLEVGPLFRVSNISKKCQRRAMKKMKNLSFRPPEQLLSMKFCVDLIQYATNNLDAGVKTINQFLGSSFHKGMTYVQDIKQHATLHEMKEKLQSLTMDAIQAIGASLEIVSRHIPINTIPSKTYESIRERIRNLRTRKDVFHFAEICRDSIGKLHKANSALDSYISKNETMPQQLLLVARKLHSAMENLANSASYFIDDTVEGKEKPEEKKEKVEQDLLQKTEDQCQ
jgi:hypothetical protein